MTNTPGTGVAIDDIQEEHCRRLVNGMRCSKKLGMYSSSFRFFIGVLKFSSSIGSASKI